MLTDREFLKLITKQLYCEIRSLFVVQLQSPYKAINFAFGFGKVDRPKMDTSPIATPTVLDLVLLQPIVVKRVLKFKLWQYNVKLCWKRVDKYWRYELNEQTRGKNTWQLVCISKMSWPKYVWNIPWFVVLFCKTKFVNMISLNIYNNQRIHINLSLGIPRMKFFHRNSERLFETITLEMCMQRNLVYIIVDNKVNYLAIFSCPCPPSFAL